MFVSYCQCFCWIIISCAFKNLPLLWVWKYSRYGENTGKKDFTLQTNLSSPVIDLDLVSLPEREATLISNFKWSNFHLSGLCSLYQVFTFCMRRLKGEKTVVVWECVRDEPKQRSFNCLDHIQPGSWSPAPSRAEFGIVRHGSTADGVDLSRLEFEKQAVSCAFFTLMLIKNLTFWEVSVLVHPRVL